jgi:hypothetical protein
MIFSPRRRRKFNGVFEIRPRHTLKRIIQTYFVKSHSVTYKPIAPADNPAQFEFNCTGQNDFYIDLNSLCLLLRFKLVKTDG